MNKSARADARVLPPEAPTPSVEPEADAPDVRMITKLVDVMLSGLQRRGETLSDGILAHMVKCRCRAQAPPVPFTDAVIAEAITLARRSNQHETSTGTT